MSLVSLCMVFVLLGVVRMSWVVVSMSGCVLVIVIG